MRELINYYFLSDVVEGMDKKYYNEIKDNLSRLFVISNFKEFFLYHNFFKNTKNNDYGLYKKLNNNKIEETLNLLIREIQENDYNKEMIILTYSYVSTIILNAYLDEYVQQMLILKTLQHYYRFISAIEAITYKNKTNKSINALEITKEFNLTLSETEINLIEKIIKEIHYVSFGKHLLNNSLIQYTKYQHKYNVDKIGFKKFRLRIMNIFHNKRMIELPQLSRFISQKKLIDYRNNNEKEITIFKEKGPFKYNDIYYMALKKTKEIMKLLNEQIYYHKNNLNKIMNQINKIKNKD